VTADAAREAVNHLNVDNRVTATWHYLLVGEADVKHSKEAWSALKGLGH
jgi:hypothetical protein